MAFQAPRLAHSVAPAAEAMRDTSMVRRRKSCTDGPRMKGSSTAPLSRGAGRLVERIVASRFHLPSTQSKRKDLGSNDSRDTSTRRQVRSRKDGFATTAVQLQRSQRRRR